MKPSLHSIRHVLVAESLAPREVPRFLMECIFKLIMPLNAVAACTVGQTAAPNSIVSYFRAMLQDSPPVAFIAIKQMQYLSIPLLYLIMVCPAVEGWYFKMRAMPQF